jgi:hypothetical protein
MLPAYVPVPHGVHAATPPTENWPIEHPVQLAEDGDPDCGEKVPAPQLVQLAEDEAPAVGEKNPAGQLVHRLDEDAPVYVE